MLSALSPPPPSCPSVTPKVSCLFSVCRVHDHCKRVFLWFPNPTSFELGFFLLGPILGQRFLSFDVLLFVPVYGPGPPPPEARGLKNPRCLFSEVCHISPLIPELFPRHLIDPLLSEDPRRVFSSLLLPVPVFSTWPFAVLFLQPLHGFLSRGPPFLPVR